MTVKCPTCNQPLPLDKNAQAKAKRAIKEAQRKAEWNAGLPARQAAADDDYARMNFRQVDDFLAGRTPENASSPPSPTEWEAMKDGWTPKQYALTAPSLQGSVPSNRFGSMAGNTATEIAAEKWRLLAAASTP